MNRLVETDTAEQLRAHLEAIVDSSDDAIFSKNLDGIITSWNPGAERLYGYTAEEVIGQPVSMLLSENRTDEIPAIMDRLRRGERVEHYEAVGRAKDGRLLDISLTVLPIRDGKGRILGASTVGRDITKSKQTERTLARELRAHKRLQEISCRLIPAEDTKTLYKELIDAAIDITQADRGTMQELESETCELCLLEARGMPDQVWDKYSRLPPDSHTSCALALQLGERVTVDYATDERVAGTADAQAHLDIGIRAAQSTPLVTRSGRLMGMMTTHWNQAHQLSHRQFHMLDILARQATDLLERAKTEEARRKSEQRLRFRSEQFETLLNQAPLGMYLVDADFRLRQVNPSAEPVFAGLSGGVIGRDFGEILHAVWGRDHADELARIFRHTLETGEPYHVPEFSQCRADRNVTEYYDWRIDRIVLPDGRYGVVCYFRDVSERVHAQQMITKSEMRYRTLLESIDEGFGIIEMLFNEHGRPVDYRFLEANHALVRHTGLHDAVGKTARELVPNLEQRWFDTYGWVAMTGKPARFVEYSKAMGRWFEVDALRTGEPEQRRVALLFRDITARKRSEQRLRESEERLRFTLAASGFGTWDLDLTTPPPYPATRSLKHDQIFGYKELLSEWTNELFFNHVLDEDRSHVKTRFEDALQNGNDWEIECRIRRVDGPIRWIWAQGRISSDSKGRPQRMLGLVADITTRKQSEHRLRESEERLRLARSAAGLGIHDYNVATGVIEWDERTREMWGVGKKEPITYDLWLNGIHPEDQSMAEAAVHRALDPKGEGTYLAEYRVISRRDGVTRWVQATGDTTFSHGKPVRLVGTVQDITARRLAEETLKEADRRKDEFLATLAHELRNPLAAIRAAMSVMGYASNDPACVDEMTAIIDRQSSQLTRLIDDLMDVSRISRGKVTLERQPINVADIVSEVVGDWQVASRENGLNVYAAVPEQPVIIDADPIRVAQVVNNLVNNACKFTDRGGEVRVAVEREGDQALVRVTDTGIGIPPEQVSRIFDMFTQIEDSPDQRTGGLGIGLSLSKSIIEMHGGSIEARSEGPGKGSEFLVRLQTAQCKEQQRETPEVKVIGAPGSNHAQHPRQMAIRRILAADDNRDTLRAVATMLRMQGHTVDTATDGTEALEKVRKTRPDIALLDIGMPGRDGYEVAECIRREPWGNNILLVAMTGWGQDRDKQDARNAGFDLHLTKPVDSGALEQLLTARKNNEPAAADHTANQRA